MRIDHIKTHPFIEASRNYSEYPAIITNDSSLSYSELYKKAYGLFQILSQHKLRESDRVILDDLEPLETIISIWACAIGGFEVFPLNPRYPDEELVKIARSVQPAIILSSRNLIPNSSILFPPLSDIELDDNPLPERDLNDPATLVMTSGSSGTARIVQHSHSNHIWSALGSNQNIGLEITDKWLLTLPLYHVGGLSILFRTAIAGAAIVIPEDPKEILKTAKHHGVTHLSLVATQLQRMLQDPDEGELFGSIKHMLLGGSAFPEHLIESALDFKLPIHLSYGSTEMASQITCTDGNDRIQGLKNSGKLLAGRDLIISHEGEILVKGDTLALGYIGESGLADFRDSEGWLHTRDVGYIDVSGSLTVTGRIDNQFISGGENIQPEHIEAALCRIENISQAIILPGPDSEFGYRPIAYLQSESKTPPRDFIVRELKKSLPGFMIPTDFYRLPEELITNRLKISRKELADYILRGNKHLQPLS